MASSESKAKSEGDVTPAGEENLKLDDDTSKGEYSCYSLTRTRCLTGKLFNVNLYSCKRTELSPWMKIQQMPLNVKYSVCPVII